MPNPIVIEIKSDNPECYHSNTLIITAGASPAASSEMDVKARSTTEASIRSEVTNVMNPRTEIKTMSFSFPSHRVNGGKALTSDCDMVTSKLLEVDAIVAKMSAITTPAIKPGK